MQLYDYLIAVSTPAILHDKKEWMKVDDGKGRSHPDLHVACDDAPPAAKVFSGPNLSLCASAVRKSITASLPSKRPSKRGMAPFLSHVSSSCENGSIVIYE